MGSSFGIVIAMFTPPIIDLIFWVIAYHLLFALISKMIYRSITDSFELFTNKIVIDIEREQKKDKESK